MKYRALGAAIVVAGVVTLFWVGWARFAPDWINDGNDDQDAKSRYSQPGVFGDMFGALNTLFTGLAFAGLVYTIIQQHEQLMLAKSG